MSKPDVIYDLRRFAAGLPDGHRQLRKRVRRWVDGHSIATDLRLARDSLASALRLHATGRESLQLAVMALTHSAIVTYARALERHSEHRGTVAIMDRLSAAEIRMHDAICTLRDDGLAHFGPAGASEPWSQDHALLMQTGEHWQPVTSAQRALFDPVFARELHAHIESVAEKVSEIVDQRRVEFETLFHVLIEDELVGDALEASALTDAEAERFQPVYEDPRTGRKIVTR